MKTIFTLLLFIFSSQVFAAKGVVRVLEAPLLNKPNLNAEVVETRKQGEEIYIHDGQVSPSSYKPDYSNNLPQGKVEDGWEKEGFFQTLDSSSSPAYIEKRYVKIIYNDTREQATRLGPYEEDPTDYRLEEPLPENYPFYEKKQRRADLAFVTGPARQTSYQYNQGILREDQGSRLGITGSYTGKLSDDPYNRFYFGGQFHFQYQNSEYILADGSYSQESFGQLGAGPIMTYNFFRTKNYRLTVGGGITLNFHRALVRRRNTSQQIAEERIFEGFSITPKFRTHLVKSNFIPHVDLLFGVEAQMNLEHTLSAKQPVVVDELWNPQNQGYTFPTGGIYALFFGVQSSY